MARTKKQPQHFPAPAINLVVSLSPQQTITNGTSSKLSTVLRYVIDDVIDDSHRSRNHLALRTAFEKHIDQCFISCMCVLLRVVLINICAFVYRSVEFHKQT